MYFDQLPPVSYEELVLGVQREIQFWNLPDGHFSAILALTPGPGENSLAELAYFPLSANDDLMNGLKEYMKERLPFGTSFFHNNISQILKMEAAWSEGIIPSRKEESDEKDGDGLLPPGVGRYFLFPLPVVATPVVFFLLAPGTNWEGSAEGLYLGVMHLADRLSSLHLAVNLLRAFMPETLSGIANEQELVSLFAARIAQLLLPSQYQINVSDKPEPEKWQKYSLNIPSSQEIFKIPLRRNYLLYHLSTLKIHLVQTAAPNRDLSKIKARKEHLRVLMERSYAYIYECWQSVAKADHVVTQSALRLTQELNFLRTTLSESAEKTETLVNRLAVKLSSIGIGRSNAFYRTSYGWMLFYENQMVMLSSDQEDGFTCLHHLLAHPDIPFSIESMVNVVNNYSRRKQKKKQQKDSVLGQVDFDENEIEMLFSQRGFQFSAEQLWQEVNNMGSETSLQEALLRYEAKSALSKDAFEDLPPKEKEQVLILFLHALVCQRFILRQIIKRYDNEVYRSKCKAVEDQINKITFLLKEDPEINPNPDALEFFEDIRIDVYNDQSVATVSKSKEEKKKIYENITKAIGRAIENIESEKLQEHLREHLDIGDPCCYRPAALKIRWTTETPN